MSVPSEVLTLVTDQDAAGRRLDRWLTDELPERSRSEIQRWIRDARVLVDGTEAKAGAKLAGGQQIEIHIPPPPADQSLTAQDIPLAIVYEDDDMLVVDKPAGMVVHPAPGHSSGTLVNAVLHHCPDLQGVGGERRPGIVHRLDQETSGLLVVAKHDQAHRHLQTQFKARTVYKEYLALVEGRPDPPQGRIAAPLGRHPVDRKRQAVFTKPGQAGRSRAAVTDYVTLATYSVPVRGSTALGHFSLMRVVIQTGRTHQIRVHFAWRHHPVVGDTLYGPKRQRLPAPRQFLHAHRLRLRLPSTNEEREFAAPLPPDLQTLLDMLKEQTQ